MTVFGQQACRVRDVGSSLVVAARAQRHDVWTSAQLAAHQLAALRVLVRWAAVRSPFYARRLPAGLADVPAATAQELLALLPVVRREDMLAELDDVLTDRRLDRAALDAAVRLPGEDPLLHGRYRVLSTSGTTGTPLPVVFDRPEWIQVMAAQPRGAGLMGFAPRLPRTRLASVWGAGPRHMTHRLGTTADVGLFCRLRLPATAPLPYMRQRLQEFRPQVLAGYASALELLAQEQLAGRLDLLPHTVFSSSERLSPAARTACATAWGVDVRDTYATTETGPIAFSCGRGKGMHVLEDGCLVESVDADGRPAADGETGAATLVTNLWARTQPFLRYQLSDRLTLTAEPCACGRPFRRILSVDGRADDVLSLPARDGGTVRVLSDSLLAALDGTPGVRGYQVTQEGPGLRVDVLTDRGEDLDLEVTRRLAVALTPLGTAPVPVIVARPERLDRDPQTGKLQQVRTTR